LIRPIFSGHFARATGGRTATVDERRWRYALIVVSRSTVVPTQAGLPCHCSSILSIKRTTKAFLLLIWRWFLNAHVKWWWEVIAGRGRGSRHRTGGRGRVQRVVGDRILRRLTRITAAGMETLSTTNRIFSFLVAPQGSFFLLCRGILRHWCFHFRGWLALLGRRISPLVDNLARASCVDR
jgi:hypothetical protein